MAYDILKGMEREGSLNGCFMSMSEKSQSRSVFGKDIISVDRSKTVFLGGETGQERMEAPLDSILEISVGGTVIFRRKKRIEKVYPRKSGD